MGMSMAEVEADILNDLAELGEGLGQYTYLLECARECAPAGDGLRSPEHLVRDCVVSTWVRAEVRDGRVSFEGDSESMLVRGAIALLEEIYDGREAAEAAGFECHLLDDALFTRHFSPKQRAGLSGIVADLRCAVGER